MVHQNSPKPCAMALDRQGAFCFGGQMTKGLLLTGSLFKNSTAGEPHDSKGKEHGGVPSADAHFTGK